MLVMVAPSWRETPLCLPLVPVKANKLEEYPLWTLGEQMEAGRLNWARHFSNRGIESLTPGKQKLPGAAASCLKYMCGGGVGRRRNLPCLFQQLEKAEEALEEETGGREEETEAV